MASSDRYDVICLSLEPWNDVWRRNQLFATAILQLRPTMRLLFAETPIDIPWTLRQGRLPKVSGLRSVGESGRLWAMAPHKWLPRRIWSGGDESLFRQVLSAARGLQFDRPVLWINDSMYAPLIERTGWSSVYDVTDDWLLARASPREMERQGVNDANALRHADEVVACSPALVDSRGRDRTVHLVTNGVDIDHLRAPTTRPPDLPAGRVVLYQGTLSAERLDIDLCVRVARGLAGRATLVILGPNSLTRSAEAAVLGSGAVLLGSRPYSQMPAYLQHADVLVVPHLITPFTESLDPIKAREFVAVARPVVSTPVAGFRGLDRQVVVRDRESFLDAVRAALDGPTLPPGPGELVGAPATWAGQAAAFLELLDAAASTAARS